jgi:hypothetical protein
MAAQLGQSLSGTHDDLSRHLLAEGAGYDHLVEVCEMLEAENARVLMIWDGVDRAIESGELTRNLWDNLLALGRRNSLWLITASRQKLQTLIRDAASVTSEFWLLLDPLTITPMDEVDIQAFLDSKSSLCVAPGAVKEILNWTGGVPPLVASLLNQVAERGSGSITSAIIQEAALGIDERSNGLLDSLWKDCPASARDLYASLCESGSEPYSTLPKKERQLLLFLGFARQEKNQLNASCRLLQDQVIGANPETGALSRMFGTREVYESNIRGILERRLAQTDRFDDRLFHLVENSLRELPNHPDLCLANLSHIEDQAFEVIWSKEVGPGRTIPQAWITYWTSHEKKNLPKPIQDMIARDEWEIKNDRGPQLAILQLVTGSHQVVTDCLATFATKDAYVLINAIHCFRNRSEHSGGQSIPLGVAVAGLSLCIELIGCLNLSLEATEL